VTKKPSPKGDENLNEKTLHRFTIGSLSHLLKQTAHGYIPLPDWTEVAGDPELRKVAFVQQNSFLNPYGIGGKYTGFGSGSFPNGPPQNPHSWDNRGGPGPGQSGQRSFDADLNAFYGDYDEEYYDEEYDGEYDEEYDGEYDEEYDGEYDEEYDGEYDEEAGEEVAQ